MNPKYKDRNAGYCKRYYDRMRANPAKWHDFLTRRAIRLKIKKCGFRPS
jgi:hypothetical protein